MSGYEHDALRARTEFEYLSYEGIYQSKSVFAPGAKCPNHKCRLYLTNQPGVGVCEISGYTFEYDEGPAVNDEDQEKWEIRIINGKPQRVLKQGGQTQRKVL